MVVHTKILVTSNVIKKSFLSQFRKFNFTMIMHFTTFSLITYLAEIPSVTLVSISNMWDFTAAVWVTYFIADGNKLLRELPDRTMLLNDSFFCAEKLAHFIEHLPSFGHLPIVCSTQYCIQNFFGLVDSLFAKGKVLKIYLSRLAQNAFLGPFLHNYCKSSLSSFLIK